MGQLSPLGSRIMRAVDFRRIFAMGMKAGAPNFFSKARKPPRLSPLRLALKLFGHQLGKLVPQLRKFSLLNRHRML